ncbi:MAG: hypothetical protein GHCLOJNM_03493 [bacterium]|nr:hypothetical protein [bacterium]
MKRTAFAVLGLIFSALPPHRAAAADSFRWNHELTGEAVADSLRDAHVEWNAQELCFTLAPTHLLSDCMGRTATHPEPLSPEVRLKKVFHLDSRPTSAEALFYVNWDKRPIPMEVTLNGHPIPHVRDPAKMRRGGWDRVTLPGNLLRSGANEIVLGGTGTLFLDTDAPGGNTFKRLTRDGEWRSDTLGNDKNLRGELLLRVRVKGFPREGVVTSEIQDLWELLVEGFPAGPAPILETQTLFLTPKVEVPPRASVVFEARTGAARDGAPEHWSPWRPLEVVRSMPRGHRFFQWRATMRTEDCLVTPRVFGIRLEGETHRLGVNRSAVKVVEPPDQEVAVSSYPFAHAEPNHPKMKLLRDRHELAKVVEAGKTDLEKLHLLARWARGRWEGWDDGVYGYSPQWDALEILDWGARKLGHCMCAHYAVVFVQAAAALGYPAREVILDYHCLAEAWSDEYGKWVVVDVGLLPNYPESLLYFENGVPLNALELHRRYLAGTIASVTSSPPPNAPLPEFWNRFGDLYTRFAIPLRNDHLYVPEPQELRHGRDQYRWDGFLWWTDSLDPEYPEFSLQSNRPEDFYWTLNKTLIDLEDTETAGALRVRLSGPIPNLRTFQLKRSEDDAWRDSPAEFDWNLKPGVNRLQARAVNTMGRELPPNALTLEYSP